MDFLTHTLVGAGAARLICSERKLLPQASLAAMLGALLIDGDPWLYLIDPEWYGRYHRVVTHSIIGMICMTLLSAALAKGVLRFAPARRFGWFVSPNLRQCDTPAASSPWRLLLCCAMAGVGLHWLFDVITGFGNMLPFWPWSPYDVSLQAVFSFDFFIFSFTIAWHLLLRQLEPLRRKELLISGGYVLCIFVYVLARYLWGAKTYF